MIKSNSMKRQITVNGAVIGAQKSSYRYIHHNHIS